MFLWQGISLGVVLLEYQHIVYYMRLLVHIVPSRKSAKSCLFDLITTVTS